MATYRYLFCDALTGALIEELPLSCQSFTQQISGAGALTGTLALGDIVPGWRAATLPKHTTIIVMRDAQVVWGGWISKRRPTNGGSAAEISAETLEGWLGRQEIQIDAPYIAADVFTIVRGIIAQVAAQAGGNVRLDTGVNVSGLAATVTYLGKDSTKLSDAISKLADVAPGFEYTISWQRSGSVFTPFLTLATPGLSSTLDAIVLEYPGNLMNYDYPEDSTASANAMTGVGADAGGSPLIARVDDTSGELAGGYLRMPGQLQAKDESDVPRLLARTTTALTAALVDYVVPTAELRSDTAPQFGDFPLGIPARLRATSLYHPAGVNGVPGLDVTRRVTGWTVNPQGDERVTLALASTTGKITPPVAGRYSNYIADLDRRIREMASRT